ncbi:MAG: M61 family peptidase [Candidatus Hydrogenedentes bacterium]|nr:M61 family peptidase [Candidatus Hydrogenedentota bacterium]
MHVLNLALTKRRGRRWLAALSVAFAVTVAAFAQRPIELSVDVSSAPQRIYRVHMVAPVKPGALRLAYPKWIQGEHSPSGPVMDVTGLHLSANGKPIEWRRDLRDMFVIECRVPRGVSELTVDFDYLPVQTDAPFTGGVETTSTMGVLYWSQVVFYPERARAQDVLVRPTLRLPDNWVAGGALLRDESGASDGAIRYRTVTLDELVDTPVLFGKHLRSIALEPRTPDNVPRVMDIAAESEWALALPEERIKQYGNMIDEMYSFLGAGHYDRYHFLVTLSDQLQYFGMEHHRTSDCRLVEKAMVEDAFHKWHAELIPHEYFHSWNGKAIRPKGLATDNLQETLETDMLWIYEGMTSYYGKVLAARSGMWSQEEARDIVAKTAGRQEATLGRTWRPFRDVCDAAQIIYPAPKAGSKWRRGADFYPEGTLIWLDADVLIRKLSGGAKTLDDFCSLYLRAGENGKVFETPVTPDDVYKTLSEVQPYDWKRFFEERLRSTSPKAPLDGITEGGWRLVYTSTPNTSFESPDGGPLDCSSTLGMTVAGDGAILDVTPGMAAFEAGLGPGMRIVALNNRRFTTGLLTRAIKESRTATEPMQVLIENGDYFSTHAVTYKDGERQPHLERDESKPDLLSAIFAPRVAK